MRFRYTLPSFVVLISAASALAAKTPDESQAIAELEQLGGQAIRDETIPGRPGTEVRVRGKNFLDNDLPLLKSFGNLTSLKMGGTSITDFGLKHVAELTKLTQLDLPETPLTDAGMESIGKLKRLAHLNLYST